jgi:hypothetical protein
MKLEELNENKLEGRWVKTKGPNNTAGFHLQQKQRNGWKTLGFVTKIPKRKTGMITVFNGMVDIDADLDKLDIQ